MARRRSRYDFSEEARRTNAELDAELAQLTALSADDLRRLLPTRAEKEKLRQLIGIVRGARSRNQAVARLRASIDDLGEVVVKLLERVLG